jgi:hypothetical protein
MAFWLLQLWLYCDPDLLAAGMCSAYTALPDSASAAQYSPT